MNKVCVAAMFFTVVYPLLAEQVTLKFKIFDEHGSPVKHARIVTAVETEESLSRWHGSPKFDQHVAITDSGGAAVCRFKSCDGDFSVHLQADGCYEEWDVTNRFAVSYDMKQKRYVFLEKEKTLYYALRKIVNPVEMNICHSLQWRIPLKVTRRGVESASEWCRIVSSYRSFAIHIR